MSFCAQVSRARLTGYALVVATLAFTPIAHAATWTGLGSDAYWLTNGNWIGGTPPGPTGDTVTFDSNSTAVANLATVNNFTGLSLNSITVGAVPAITAVSIGGNGFTLTGATGIDMSAGAGTQALTIALDGGQSITLGGSQTWKLLASTTGGTNQTLTINSPIAGAAGANLTYGVTTDGTGAHTTGFVKLLAPNTYLGNTTLGGPNTTYLLDSDSPFGVGGTVTSNSFNTAPRFQTLLNPVTISNPMNFTSGFRMEAASFSSLTFAGPITFNGNTGTGTSGNRTINNLSIQTITLNNTVTTSTVGDTLAKNFLLIGPGDIVVNGDILDQTGGIPLAKLQKQGASTVYLNSTNSNYAGVVSIEQGTLVVASLADVGTVSSLGKGTGTGEIQIGLNGNPGTLRYAGSTPVSTNRQLRLTGSATTGGATLDSIGAGTMSFTSTTFGVAGASAKTFTLTGTNTGANTIAGVIANSTSSPATNTTAVSKTGVGTWVLTGASTYSGGTAVSDGTLRINNSTGSGTGDGPVSVTSTGVLGGTGIIKPGTTVGVNVDGGGTLSPGAAGIGTLTLDSSGTSGTMLTLGSSGVIFDELNTSSASDQVALIGGTTGDIVFNNNTINFGDLSGGTLPQGSSYILFTANVSDAYSGLTPDVNGYITPGNGLSIGSGLSAYTGAFAPTLQKVGNNIVLNIGAPTSADYNGNGIVDAADYVLWRSNPSGYGGAPGYTLWRSHFGLPSGSGSGLGSSAVPEPTALVLAALGMLMGGALRRRP